VGCKTSSHKNATIHYWVVKPAVTKNATIHYFLKYFKTYEKQCLLFTLHRLTDKLDYGHGLLQVESCFERLKQMPADYLPASLYAIDVHVAEMNGSVCSSFATGRRGIYIRERHQLGGIGNGDGEAAQFSDFIVRVEPRFAERAGEQNEGF
jgi:hypothetical protein